MVQIAAGSLPLAEADSIGSVRVFIYNRSLGDASCPFGRSLTEIHLEVKMPVVDKMFVGSQYHTEVWATDRVFDEVEGFARVNDEGRQFRLKLEHFARAGFAVFEKKGPIRHMDDGVYRVGLHSSLFRVYGFYDGVGKRSFIAIDALMKRTTRISSAEKRRINEVARVKRMDLWNKRESND